MIVMKFGGTSMGSPAAIRVVAQILADHCDRRPVAVVSAMAGVTDLLFEATALARDGHRRRVESVVAAIWKQHEDAAVELLGDVEASAWSGRTRSLLAELRDLLLGATLLREVSARAQDAISGYGELFAASLLTAHLRSCAQDAVFVDGRQLVITDETHGRAIPLMDRTARRASRHLQPVLARKGLPVIPGFIGSTVQGVPTTLGRGGSDLSASVVGSVLPADDIWIWTDVDGILSADPRLEPHARLLTHLSFAEAAELAHFGAKVLHPRTMWPAIERGIPVRVRNTFNPSCAGTRIEAQGEAHPDIVKGVTAITGLALVAVEGPGILGVPGMAARVFGAVAGMEVNVLLISQGSSELTICFVVEMVAVKMVEQAVNAEFRRERLHEDIKPVIIHSPVAIVAAVGDGMRGTPGVAARIFMAVGKAGVNVLAVAQGSSERNISFVVQEIDAGPAVRALHREYVEVAGA